MRGIFYLHAKSVLFAQNPTTGNIFLRCPKCFANTVNKFRRTGSICTAGYGCPSLPDRLLRPINQLITLIRADIVAKSRYTCSVGRKLITPKLAVIRSLYIQFFPCGGIVAVCQVIQLLRITHITQHNHRLGRAGFLYCYFILWPRHRRQNTYNQHHDQKLNKRKSFFHFCPYTARQTGHTTSQQIFIFPMYRVSKKKNGSRAGGFNGQIQQKNNR